MSASVNKIPNQKIIDIRSSRFIQPTPKTRKRILRPDFLFSSGLAVLALVLGLAYVDEMVGQNWLMMPLE